MIGQSDLSLDIVVSLGGNIVADFQAPIIGGRHIKHLPWSAPSRLPAVCRVRDRQQDVTGMVPSRCTRPILFVDRNARIDTHV